MLRGMERQERTVQARFLDSNPFHRLLRVELLEHSPGHARLRLPAREELRGGVAGSLHGGVLSALADVACLAAMQGLFDGASQPAGTAELNISYLRPALGAYVTAEARVLKKGRTLAVVDVDIRDP